MYDWIINEANQLMEDINLFVQKNLKHKDSKGFSFLTNIHKGEPMPFEFAYKWGFKQPIFEVKKMYKMPNVSEEEYLIVSNNWEGIWVKEGLTTK